MTFSFSPSFCLVWVDKFEDEIGYRITLDYFHSGERFVYEITGSDVAQFYVPEANAPRLSESREQCLKRQDFTVFVTAVRPSGDWLIDGFAATMHCSGGLPTATSQPTLTQTPLATALPTRWPEHESIAMPEAIGSHLFISGNTLWFVEENENQAQIVSLGGRDDMLPETLAQTPDGTQLAWLAVNAEEQAVAGAERRNIRQAYPVVLDLNTQMLTRYFEVPVDRRSGLVWSASGTHLYLKMFNPDPAQQADLYQLEVATGHVEKLATLGDSYDLLTGNFGLTPDEELLFTWVTAATADRQGGRLSLASFDLDTGEKEILVEIIDALNWRDNAWEGAFLSFALNPQGDQIAFTIGSRLDPDMRRLEEQGLYLVEPNEKMPERVVAELGLGAPLFSPDGQRLAVAGGVAEGNVLLIYEQQTAKTTFLTEEQLTQIKLLANPAERPFSFLSITPAIWLNNQQLGLRIAFAFTEDPAAVQRMNMIMNLNSGEIGKIAPTPRDNP